MFDDNKGRREVAHFKHVNICQGVWQKWATLKFGQKQRVRERTKKNDFSIGNTTMLKYGENHDIHERSKIWV